MFQVPAEKRAAVPAAVVTRGAEHTFPSRWGTRPAQRGRSLRTACAGRAEAESPLLVPDGEGPVLGPVRGCGDRSNSCFHLVSL